MDDIQGWLSDIDPALARKYTDILVENGFDDLDALHHIDEETLDDLLIHDVTDRTAILLAIESLGPPGYPVSSPSRESSVGSDYYINADISSGSYDEKGEDDIFSAYHDPEDHDDDIYQEPVMTDISSDNDIVADLGSSTFQSRRSSEFPGSFSGPQKHAERRNTAPEIRIDPPASPPTPSSTSRPSSLLSVNHEQWGSVAANGQLRVTIIRARDLSGGDSPPSTSVKLVSLSGLTPQELTFGKTRLVKADRNPNFLENFTLLVKPDSHCFFVIYVRQRNATRNTWDEIGSCRIFLEWATEGHPCKELWHPLRDGASSSSRCVGEILIKLEWSQGTTNERQRSYLGRMEEEFPTDCFAFRKLYEGSYALPQAKNGSCALEYLVAVVENVIYLKLKGTLFLSDYRLVHIPYTEKHRNRQLCIMLSSITKVDLVYGEDGGFELQIGDRSFKLLRFVVPFGEDGAKPKRSSANEESTEDSSFKSTIREGMKSAFKEAKRMARAATGDKSLDVKKATPDSISSLGARRCLLALIRLSEEIRWICREGDFDWTLSHGIDDNLAPWGRLPHCTVRRLCTQKNNSCDFSVVLAKGIPDLGSVTKTPQSSPSDNKKQGAEAIKSAMKRINLHKNNAWKIIVNIDEFNCHKICETYPPLIVVPSKFRTDIIIKASKFRTKRRLPSLTWIHPENKAPLVRCAQPKTGMLKNLIPEDTLLLNAIRETVTNIFDDPAKEVLRIFDARPFVNAAANAATKGAGFENIKELGGNQRAKIEWLNIGNIHAVRSSIQELHDNTDSHFFGAVGGWIEHIHNILEGSVAIMTALNFGQPTLVHCSDGWDRTAQLCATAQLLLDPHYRTIDGFAELVNKDWCDYGYQFEKRSSGFGKEFERKDISPIFEQWLDVVFQIYHQYETHFEFNEEFLLFLADASNLCIYREFSHDSYKKRQNDSFRLSVWDTVQRWKRQFMNPVYLPDQSSAIVPNFAMHNLVIWRNRHIQESACSVAGKTHIWERFRRKELQLNMLMCNLPADLKSGSGCTTGVLTSQIARIVDLLANGPGIQYFESVNECDLSGLLEQLESDEIDSQKELNKYLAKVKERQLYQSEAVANQGLQNIVSMTAPGRNDEISLHAALGNGWNVSVSTYSVNKLEKDKYAAFILQTECRGDCETDRICYSVSRRFSDFEKLRSILCEESIVLEALPRKTLFQKLRPEFLEERRLSLDQWVKQLPSIYEGVKSAVIRHSIENFVRDA